jgi:hypothetical protein
MSAPVKELSEIEQEDPGPTEKQVREYFAEQEKRRETLYRILPQLAALARIPEARRLDFYKALPGGHGSRWTQDQRHKAGAALPRNGALAKAARAMRAASEALGDFNEKERKRLELALRALNLNDDFFLLGDSFADNFEECHSMAATLADALAWANGTAPAQPINGPRRPGRPKGAKANRHFHMFVGRLLWAVGSCGGKLPFDRKKGASEPLVRAIYLLKPLLPDGFLPNVPPLPTIERIVIDYRKNPGRF